MPLVKRAIPGWILRQRLTHRRRGAVLLTFDDGPCPNATPRGHDSLDRGNVKAVFFIPGVGAAQTPQLFGKILTRGHRLGNHTFSHSSQGKFSEQLADIRRCQDLLYAHTGHRPCCFRPPRGRLTSRIGPSLESPVRTGPAQGANHAADNENLA